MTKKAASDASVVSAVIAKQGVIGFFKHNFPVIQNHGNAAIGTEGRTVISVLNPPLLCRHRLCHGTVRGGVATGIAAAEQDFAIVLDVGVDEVCIITSQHALPSFGLIRLTRPS